MMNENLSNPNESATKQNVTASSTIHCRCPGCGIEYTTTLEELDLESKMEHLMCWLCAHEAPAEDFMKRNLKKVRIYTRVTEDSMAAGVCYIPSEGNNPMQGIVTSLELLSFADSYRVVQSDFEEKDMEYELLRFICDDIPEVDRDWEALKQEFMRWIKMHDSDLEEWIETCFKPENGHEPTEKDIAEFFLELEIQDKKDLAEREKSTKS